MERRPFYLAAFGWIVAGVTGAVLAALAVDQLGLRPPEFASSTAAAAVLGLVFARRPAEGIGAFLLFILFADNWEYWLGLDLRLADEGTVVAFLALGVLRKFFVADRLRFGLKEAGLAVLVASGVVSSLINDVPLAVWGPALILLSKAVVFFYLVSCLSLTIDDVERVGFVIGSVALLIVGLGYAELLDPPAFQAAFRLPLEIDERGDVTVVRSLFLHPALYGWISVFVSLFLYARLLVVHSWWALPLALLANVGIVLSARRTPLIGLPVALIAGLVWHARAWPSLRIALRVWVPILVAVLALMVVLWPALTRIYEYTVDEYVAPRNLIAEILSPNPDPDVISEVQPRVALYVGSLAIARDYFPLGAGLGRYGSHMSRAEYSPLYGAYGLDRIAELASGNPTAVTDTFWPMVLGEAGVLGLIGFSAFVGVLLVTLWKVASSADTLASRSFALGALLLFVESLVGSLTAATYAAPPIAYFVFAASGASLALVAPIQKLALGDRP